ncbi:MAG: hypothetical protein U1C46_03010 [Bacteroidales bacterium]|nr:hypothetical protein [Bacteroidales bacterium]MDZ4203768.1 hypothetical protein [Bacteroidales bacterium]
MNLKTTLSKLYIVLLIVVNTPVNTYCQVEQTSLAKHSMISFVPQFLINNGIRIDYDRRLNEKHWLQLAPQFYLREHSVTPDNDVTNKFNRLVGAGLHVYHRFYPGAGPGHNGVYISYGLTGQYFDMQYDEKILTNSVERYSRITKAGAEINVGSTVKFFDLFIVDFFTGLGFKYSFLKTDAVKPKRFNNFYTDYGYTGNILNLGVRIGLMP